MLNVWQKMIITDITSITGRGDAIFTDEPWTPSKFHSFARNKKLRIVSDDSLVELDIISIEAVLKSDNTEFVAFMVPPMAESGMKELIVGKEIELK